MGVIISRVVHMVNERNLAICLLCMFILCCNQRAASQVSFRPTMVFLSEGQMVQELTIQSQTDSLQEVEFSASFGFPAYDQEGGLYMDRGDDNERFLYDLSPYIRVFPEKLFLSPGQKQIVRILVRDSPNFDTGTYWTRLSIKSQVAEPEAQEQLVPVGQSTAINLVVRQNIGVYYKHGLVTTSLSLTSLNTKQNEGTLEILSRVRRDGNSPYIGSLNAELFNQSGDLVSQSSIVINAFFDTVLATMLNIEDVPNGEYMLKLRFSTTRGDVTGNRLVNGPDLVVEERVTLSGGTP